MERIANIFSLIVVLGMITTIVSHKETKNDIQALGSAFTNALKAAMGH